MKYRCIKAFPGFNVGFITEEFYVRDKEGDKSHILSGKDWPEYFEPVEEECICSPKECLYFCEAKQHMNCYTTHQKGLEVPVPKTSKPVEKGKIEKVLDIGGHSTGSVLRELWGKQCEIIDKLNSLTKDE